MPLGGALGVLDTGATAKRKNRTRSYMNGNGDLTETENVIFYVSYRVLTEFLRMDVIVTYFYNGDTATEERIRDAGNHALCRRL